MSLEDRRSLMMNKLAVAIQTVAQGPGPVDYGLAIAGTKTRAVVKLVYGYSDAIIDDVKRSGDGTRFVVRGMSQAAASRLTAKINHGPVAVQTCEFAPDVRLPAFVVTCPAAPTDDEAWLDISAFSPGRILGDRIASLLVSPSGRAPTRFQPARFPVASGPIRSDDDLRNRILGAVNALRVQAGLAPVKLDKPQSAAIASLAPPYFAARINGDKRDLLEKIALGVRAGWKVDGSIRYGAFTAASMAASGRSHVSRRRPHHAPVQPRSAGRPRGQSDRAGRSVESGRWGRGNFGLHVRDVRRHDPRRPRIGGVV